MTTPEPPVERRRTDEIVDYRLRKIEESSEKTDRTLVDLDNKLDNLRADLFERSVFVSLTTLQLELQTRDLRIKSLEATRTTNLSERFIKWGFAIAIIAALVSPVVTVLLNQ